MMRTFFAPINVRLVSLEVSTETHTDLRVNWQLKHSDLYDDYSNIYDFNETPQYQISWKQFSISRVVPSIARNIKTVILKGIPYGC
jgi:hypothetical protein